MSLLDQLCKLRGWKRDMLGFDYSKDFYDPYLLPAMPEAVNLIIEAKKSNWPVTVFGDYDADGTTGAAILSIVLKRLGIRHSVLLPVRDEGYGLTTVAMGKVPEETRLLIMVDNGIKSVKEVEALKKRGIFTIILDHHLPGETLPMADALVDPHLPTSRYPFSSLCGGALAYKLAVALSREFPELNEAFLKWLLDLVAIATVADVMPLIGENRALVHFGLLVLRKNRRPGIRYLLEQAKVFSENLSSQSLGYIIGPRFNASGRLATNQPTLSLLLEESDSKAKLLAEEIEQANRSRLEVMREVLATTRSELFVQNDPKDHLYMIYGEGWPVGVIGLVAGRLAAEFHRPIVVGGLVGGKITASARSVAGFHLVEALDEAESFLERYGGHKLAAGLSTSEELWPKLQSKLKEIAKKRFPEKLLQAAWLIEAELSPAEVTLELVKELERLAPFGYGNPKPTFLLRNRRVDSIRRMGQAESHLKLQLSADGKSLEAVGFNLAERCKLKVGDSMSFIGQLEINEWGGRERLQLKLLDYGSVEKEIEVIKHNENQGNIFLQ